MLIVDVSNQDFIVQRGLRRRDFDTVARMFVLSFCTPPYCILGTVCRFTGLLDGSEEDKTVARLRVLFFCTRLYCILGTVCRFTGLLDGSEEDTTVVCG
jgi:hypothetical protein